MITIKLNVLFNDPFWIGIFELSQLDTDYHVCKVTFGSEPKDYEIFNFINRNFYKLKFNKIDLDNDESNKEIVKKINPKRLQRQIQKETADKGISTKAQLALQAIREENKIEHKKRSKEEKEKELQRKFKLKQDKKLKKHKGH